MYVCMYVCICICNNLTYGKFFSAHFHTKRRSIRRSADACWLLMSARTSCKCMCVSYLVGNIYAHFLSAFITHIQTLVRAKKQQKSNKKQQQQQQQQNKKQQKTRKRKSNPRVPSSPGTECGHPACRRWSEWPSSGSFAWDSGIIINTRYLDSRNPHNFHKSLSFVSVHHSHKPATNQAWENEWR